MFVRWKIRRQNRDRHGCKAGEWIAGAVLVESVRVDGKPRQRFIRHLGTVRESDVTVPRPMQLDGFWTQVGSVLDELGVLGTQRLAIESMINTMAPRPTPEAVAEHRRGFEAWKAGMAAMAQAHGRPRFR